MKKEHLIWVGLGVLAIYLYKRNKSKESHSNASGRIFGRKTDTLPCVCQITYDAGGYDNWTPPESVTGSTCTQRCFRSQPTGASGTVTVVRQSSPLRIAKRMY